MNDSSEQKGTTTWAPFYLKWGPIDLQQNPTYKWNQLIDQENSRASKVFSLGKEEEARLGCWHIKFLLQLSSDNFKLWLAYG